MCGSSVFCALWLSLAFHSPRSIINCSKWRVVVQIQWRSSDPTVEYFLENLSGITLNHFHFLYKASRELVFLLLYQSSSSLVISSAPTHRTLQITKLPKLFLQDFFENFLKTIEINILILVNSYFFIFSLLFLAVLLGLLSFILETSSCIIFVHSNE